MIAQLNGQVAWVGEDSLILNVHDVGYLVFGTTAVLQVARETPLISLWIETLVREDAITLYGFLDHAEQQLFRVLLGVQGVGARVGMALLSTFGSDTLQNLIMTQDKKNLVRAEGVGPKLADRLVLELKDKVAKGFLRSKAQAAHNATITPSHLVNPLLREGFDALSALGYKPSESLPVLESVLQHPEAPVTLENLVRQALSVLSGQARERA